MISRLPLDLFGDAEGSTETTETPDEVAVVEVDELEAEAVELAPTTVAAEDEPEAQDILLVTCQWCSTSFDNELATCPECNAKHVRVQPPDEEPTTVTCQWCLTTFDTGPETCPECHARVIVPGQHVLGENDVPLDFNSLGMMSRNAHSNQMLAGMMLGGDLDFLTGGLIGLALTLLDDD